MRPRRRRFCEPTLNVAICLYVVIIADEPNSAGYTSQSELSIYNSDTCTPDHGSSSTVVTFVEGGTWLALRSVRLPSAIREAVKSAERIE